MPLASGNDISVTLTFICVKLTGLWIATNPVEQRLLNIMLVCTLGLLFFAVWLLGTDLYYSWGDIADYVFPMFSMIGLSMSFFKVSILLTHRKDFSRLVVYLQKKFLNSNYDYYEETILNACKRVCTILIVFFTVFTEATIVCYIAKPALANIGKNETDRIFPFKVWVDLPVTVTPYFEIMFVLQILVILQAGVCYFCFDNFLCLMNLHAATQFRILQYRLENLNYDREEGALNTSSRCSCKGHVAFRCYVQQHQALIAYCDKLEKVFNAFALWQVLAFSLLICLDGYQIVMANAPTSTRITFAFHMGSCIAQLLMFTYSCDCLIRDSANVAVAMFAAPWPSLSMSKHGHMLRKDLNFVVVRSQVPCRLTALRFSTISLETYTKVISTAASYFTLLRQNT